MVAFRKNWVFFEKKLTGKTVLLEFSGPAFIVIYVYNLATKCCCTFSSVSLKPHVMRSESRGIFRSSSCRLLSFIFFSLSDHLSSYFMFILEHRYVTSIGNYFTLEPSSSSPRHLSAPRSYANCMKRRCMKGVRNKGLVYVFVGGFLLFAVECKRG